MEHHPTPTRSSGGLWPLAAAAVAIVAILAAAGVYVFKSTRDVPGDVIDRGREALHDLERIAQAFKEGTVTTSFVSYATQVSGSNYLQFATLKEMEVFERKDSASALWGRLPLPDVIVQATAPVEYTYYLDLNARWDFQLQEPERRVFVAAPPIQFNTPAIDASSIRYEVRAGSVFRDERKALEGLRDTLTELSKRRAADNVAVVRELGRRKTEEFVEKWLARSFTDARGYDVRVVFADEQPRLELGETPGPQPAPPPQTPPARP
jgi:hypothetical protein